MLSHDAGIQGVSKESFELKSLRVGFAALVNKFYCMQGFKILKF